MKSYPSSQKRSKQRKQPDTNTTWLNKKGGRKPPFGIYILRFFLLNEHVLRYAHYITVLGDKKNENAFRAFSEDVSEFVINKPDGFELSGKDGTGTPIISPTRILLGEKGFEDAFSELSIHLDEPWPTHRYPLKVIITDKRPYDIIICGSLLSLLHHFQGVIEINTDGSRQDWDRAIAYYEYTTLRSAPQLFFQN